MRILFAEDEPDLSRAVTALLEHAGYSVDPVPNGTDALDYALSGGYDALILDWMMPGKDGVRVLRELRAAGIPTPCLMLTARDAAEDRVAGLDAGADDYLPKPFDTGELLARVRALLRRRASWVPDVLRFADLALDRAGMDLKCGGKSVRLTGKSFQLMELLMEDPSAVHSVDRIMERVWGWGSDADTSVVWVNVSTLRKALASLGSRVQIRATRGAGYSLEELP